jgi:hypothetical protein
LIQDSQMDPAQFTQEFIQRFSNDVNERIGRMSN